MATFRLSGAEELARLAGRARSTRPELRKRLLSGTRKAIRPAIKKVRAAGVEKMPSGMAAWMGSAQYTSRTRTSGRTAGVRLVGMKRGHDLVRLNRGRLRHPVFANREVWVSQPVPPGFWTETLTDDHQRMIREVRSGFRDFARHFN